MGKFIRKYGVSAMYIVILSILVAFFLWSSYLYTKTMNDHLLTEARAISAQARAMKSYITVQQAAINTDSKGNYEFKGVHADEAVRKVGDMLSGNSNIMIRQVSLSARRESNDPDRFEAKALEKFKDNPAIPELYESGSIGGHKVFRYIVPLRAVNSCMECHGGEKGETDITGYLKEGYQIGELIGGLSVIVKSYNKYKLLRHNLSALLLIVFFLTFSIVLIINSIRTHFKEEVAAVRRLERGTSSSMFSDTYSAKIGGKLHKLVMHSMRNPIGDIIDTPELLSDVPLNILENSLATADKIADYSKKMIELKKLEQGKVNAVLDTFDFTSLFAERLLTYNYTCEKSGITFEGQESTRNILNVNSDKKLLFKAIDYLFVSVLKFTRKDSGKISAYLVVDNESNNIIVSVSNNTRSIGSTYEPLIFEKFTDIKDTEGQHLFNTGVELATARHILKMLGCDISYDAETKEGNMFHITMPLMSRESIA